MSIQRKISIQSEQDIVICRRICRQIAKENHFNLVDQTRITTAASELARNIFEYAGEGEVIIELVHNEDEMVGLKMSFIDHGPGIENLDVALHEGWTSHRGMGMGLSGSKKLMDEFEIQTTPGEGTKVAVIKWRQ